MSGNYKYDAFISYRHCDLDKMVAENLHKKLESFKVPGNIAKKGTLKKTKIERVFRDKDELPLASNLEDPIVKALQESEYLIVICTPRLKESLWCKREIETFISMHGRENVFAVLAEGEPYESFPEELLYTEGPICYEDGSVGIGRIAIEPLAADVRGKNKKEILKAMDDEMLRLLAPMFGLAYDDLKQRHRERRLRKVIGVSAAAAVISLTIGIGSTIAALHINKQKNQIEKQSVEIQAQAAEIASQSDAIQAQNEQLLDNQAKNMAENSLELLAEGDRTGAILTAKEALTQSEGINMPYTSEAHYALTESLHVYDSAVTYKPMMQYVTAGNATLYDVSPDGNTLAIVDEIGNIAIWDISSNECIDVLPNVMNISFLEDRMMFLNDSTLIYVMSDQVVCKYDINNKSIDSSKSYGYVNNIRTDINGEYIAVCENSYIEILDASTLESLGNLQVGENRNLSNEVFFSDEGHFFYADTPITSMEEVAAADIEASITLHVVDVKTMTEKNALELDYHYVENVRTQGNYAYILAVYSDLSAMVNYTEVIKYDMTQNEVVWGTVIDGVFSEHIVLPVIEEGEQMMVLSSLAAHFIDMNTGELVNTVALSSTPVGWGAYINNDRFMIFTSNGDYSDYYVEYEEIVTYVGRFEHNYEYIEAFDVAGEGFIMLPENKNNVTYYLLSCNPDIAPYEGTLEEKEYNLEEDKNSVAAEMKLPKIALVSDILYSDDEGLMFISYTDETVEIYNNADKTLIGSLDDISDSIDSYFGVDEEGNTYIAGDFYGYILNPEYKIIGKVENLKGVDFENKLLLVGSMDELYQLPIYSLEELIEMAE